MQYMYFTPRELINFQSTTSKLVNKPQQLNFNQIGGVPPSGPLIFNNHAF